MEILKAVAQNIRAIREQKRMTLDAAAKLTGVSRSMLAQIEKGDVNPTISVLWKIANGYKVSFTALTSWAQPPTTVIRREEAAALTEDEGRYINFPAFPFQAGRNFETYAIQIREGGRLQAQPHMGGAEEYITVFAGAVEITVDGEAFQLRQGDSIRFQANVDHGYRNIGGELVQLSLLIYYADR